MNQKGVLPGGAGKLAQHKHRDSAFLGAQWKRGGPRARRDWNRLGEDGRRVAEAGQGHAAEALQLVGQPLAGLGHAAGRNGLGLRVTYVVV